jgi:hypothetical protein
MSVARPPGVSQLFQPVIRPRYLRDQKEIEILVTLMKHTQPQPGKPRRFAFPVIELD